MPVCLRRQQNVGSSIIVIRGTALRASNEPDTGMPMLAKGSLAWVGPIRALLNGVTLFLGRDEDIEAVLARGDEGHYAAKERGRNMVRCM
jgi:GGDEF domain-containing protein